MRNIGYIQWLNQNALRSFPLSETATLLSDDGVSLPLDIIVDANIMVEEGNSANVYLSSLIFTTNTISVVIATKVLGVVRSRYIGTFLKKNVQLHTTYPLFSLDSFGQATIVFGNIDYTNVKYEFSTPNQSLFESKCVTFVKPLPVSSIIKLEGSYEENLTGIISLQPGTNVKLETRKAYKLNTSTGKFSGLFIESNAYNGDSQIANQPVMLPVYYHERFFENITNPDDEDGYFSYILIYQEAKWRVYRVESPFEDIPFTDWYKLAESVEGTHPVHCTWIIRDPELLNNWIEEDMEVIPVDVVFVVSNVDLKSQFLGPCDLVDSDSLCGGYPLRMLSEAKGKVVDGKNTIVLSVGLPNVKRDIQ